jgi:transposase
MERIASGRYAKEFREEAVRMAADGGISALEISKRLSLAKSTLENWIRISKTGNLAQIVNGQNRWSSITGKGDRRDSDHCRRLLTTVIFNTTGGMKYLVSTIDDRHQLCLRCSPAPALY